MNNINKDNKLSNSNIKISGNKKYKGTIIKVSCLLVALSFLVGFAAYIGVSVNDIKSMYNSVYTYAINVADKFIWDSTYADAESMSGSNGGIEYAGLFNNVSSSLNGVYTVDKNNNSTSIKIDGRDINIDGITEYLDKYENKLLSNKIYIRHNKKMIGIQYSKIVLGIAYKIDGKKFRYKEKLLEYLKEKELVKDLTGYKGISTSGSISEVYDTKDCLEISIQYDVNKILELISILKDYDTRAENARLSLNIGKDKFKITGGNNGYSIDLSRTVRKIENSIKDRAGTYIIQAVSSKSVPEVKKKKLLSIKKKNVVSKYSTYYGNSDKNRKRNIKNAINKLNGVVLLPGETLSFNKVTGIRTKENGYVKAGSYIDGEMTKEYGGGIPQVATTLYNSILKCGIIPEERYAHTIPVGYVPKGQDAAVVYGYKDLVFKNTTGTPIVIEGQADGDNCTIKVYGNKRTLNGYTYKLKNKKLSKSAVKTYMLKYKGNKLKGKQEVTISKYKERELVLG